MAFSKITRGVAVAGLAALLVVGCANLQVHSTASPQSESKSAKARPFDYHTTTLKNGMNVVTLEDHSTPIAAVQVWYHVGSRDEASNRRGFAHMFEHMMFRGTEHLGPKGHFEYIRGVGGDNNAYTSFDNTTFIQKVPSNQVEMVLWMEAERMGFLNINDEYFRVERDVVAEEFRMGAERPYGTVLDKILPEVFGKGTYCWSTIGNMQELKEAKAAELQKFWETYYIPNNATLVVVGDVDHAKVEEMANRYFGWMPRYPDPPAPPKPEPFPTTARKVTIKENNGPAPVVGLLWRTVPNGHPDDPALSLLGEILGQGESSRLYRDMVTDKQVAVVAAAGSFNLELDGIFGAGAVLSPMGGNKEKALAALREHIEKIKTDGVTKEELEKVKNAAERSQVTELLSVESKARQLGDAAVIKHDVEAVNTDLEKLRAVTAADVQRVAKTYLLPEREVELSIEPNTLGFLLNQLTGSKDKDKAKGKDDKKDEKIDDSVVAAGSHGKPGLKRPDYMGDKPPVASGVAKYTRPHRTEHVLDNGLKVVVIPNTEVPFVTCTLGNLNGAFTDPKDAPGTAVMAYSMLTHGTARHDYKQLTDILDHEAINIGGSADMDVASLNASAVTAKAAEAIEYMAEVVKTPTFPGSELEQLVDQQKTGRAIEEKGAEYQAEKQFQNEQTEKLDSQETKTQ